ncbi:MAG: hypothetical protein M3Z66_15535, partial [Chloroflexota bacterium]|nr:hypothetical protein [Chloroflexota bacterium]
MALHEYRYSHWDGSQEIADFSAEELLENMADDLLRGGDPERALRNLMRRGFELPDGRRFEGLQRLLKQMRQYRQETQRRYDPNGLVDAVREKLDEIMRMEREAIAQRADDSTQQSRQPRDGSQADEPRNHSSTEPTFRPGDEQQGDQSGPRSQMSTQSPDQQSSSDQGNQTSNDRQSQASGQQGQAGSGNQSGAQGTAGGQGGLAPQPGGTPDEDQFRQMLERMLDRKRQQLDTLPPDNAGRIRGLREYDFLSPEAREAFEQLVGGMQRELMEQYFQGLKQGIGNMTPEQMDGIRQMVRDMNAMLEAAQAGDREAFDRFMDQYRDYFPPGIETLEDFMEHLQRQMSAMQNLLDSMDPEQRAELEAMMDELLRDDRLRLDLARLGANLSAMGFEPQGGGFPFRGGEAPGFGQALDMMRRLQAMEDLENAIRGGDPFNAVANAGGPGAGDLFGPGLGGQIEAVQDMARSLLDAGYLQQKGDRLELTARAIRKLGDASLREIFRKLKDDRSGGHTTPRKGAGGDILQESRPYQFGDPFHVDIKGTVMNGVFRTGPGTPVQLEANDFAVFETERSVQHATVLALDMSHSMYLNG